MSALALRHAVAVAVSGALLAATLTGSSPARADDSPVKGTGKGIVGGALLGGEAGLVILSAAGAKQSWMYYTIPPALAIGGGVGGYFIEKGQEGTNAQAPMYLLAAGMALIIPAVVITLSAASYNPVNDDGGGPVTVDSGTTSSGAGLGVKMDSGAATSTTSGSPSVPTAGASSSGGGTTPTTTPTAPPKHKPSPNETRAPGLVRPQALLSLDGLGGLDGPRTLSIGVPVVSVKPMYTRDELVAFGQKQRFEVSAPVLSVAF
ncbi:MAG: hypothetical protein NVSMB47_02170 [Polyangiales bacterium]